MRSLTSVLLLGGLSLTAVTYAQDNSRTSNTPDSKIRNIDGVAAVVNTGYVTRKEIDDRIATLEKQGAKLPDASNLRKLVLDRLIIEKIQIQNAEQEGIIVTNKELDKMGSKSKILLIY